MTVECNLSARQLARLLKKLCIHDGDIVLIKSAGKEEESKEILKQVGRGVSGLKLKNVLAILVVEFDDIRTLDRQEMNAHGWYHIDQINKLTNRIAKS